MGVNLMTSNLSIDGTDQNYSTYLGTIKIVVVVTITYS